jgi:hypothetical protein
VLLAYSGQQRLALVPMSMRKHFHGRLRPTKDARRSSEPEHPATSVNGDVFFRFGYAITI